MSSRLANTIFQGRSSDTMVVVDAYEISRSEPTNGVYDTVKGIYTDAIGALNTNKSSVRRLTDLILRAKAGNIEKIDLIDGALGALGNSLPNVLGRLGGALKGKIVEGAGALIGAEGARAVEVLYNEADVLVQAGSISDLRSLLEFTGSITDVELLKLIDIEAESAVLASVAQALMDYGVPEIIDDVMEAASTDEIRDNIYKYIGGTAINGSDLGTINKIIDRIGLEGFLQYNPDAVRLILQTYTVAETVTVDQYPAKRTELVNTLTRIDSHWNTTLRAGVYIPALGPYVIASKGARMILSLEEPDRTYCLAAQTYSEKPAVEVIRELYPLAYLSST